MNASQAGWPSSDSDAGGEVHAFIGHHLEQAARYRLGVVPEVRSH